MLALPRLDPGIPLRLVPKAAKHRGARLAKVLIDAGLINAHTLPAKVASDHMATCRAALTAWFNQQLSGLRCLRPMLSLSLGESTHHGSADEGDASTLNGRIAWYGGGGTWCVGAALECLEDLHPCLGLTVLRIIEDQSWRTLPLFTASTALEVAIDFYWYGEENEAVALEEACGDDEEGREAMRSGMVTRALFEATFPKWALPGTTRRRPLGPRALAAISHRATSARVRSVIDDVRALARLRLPERATQAQEPEREQEGYFIGFAGVLAWSSDDPVTPRVVDDFEQMVGESGEYFEESGTRQVALSGPADLRAWVKDMAPWFEAVRLIDGLIFKLADRDWSRRRKGVA
jgi:PRTRC genetic system protein F